jgi:ABC-2 type transport system ATP-binding protein
VFFSSHILSDVEAICDRVAMIHKGKIMLVGAVDELVSRSGRDESVVTLRGPSPWPGFSARPGDHFEGIVANKDLQGILSDAIAKGYAVVSVTPKHGSLEDEFLRGIGERFERGAP